MNGWLNSYRNAIADSFKGASQTTLLLSVGSHFGSEPEAGFFFAATSGMFAIAEQAVRPNLQGAIMDSMVSVGTSKLPPGIGGGVSYIAGVIQDSLWTKPPVNTVFAQGVGGVCPVQ